MLPASVAAALAAAVGVDHVLTDRDVLASYETDWTGRFRGTAGAVVRAASTADVAAVVRVCASAGVPVVPQGGNTGLAGGAVPPEGAVVLSTRRMARLGPVDTVSRQVTAGAGVTVGAVQRAARAAGLDYGVDLASRDTATVGGTVATNAGGLRVVQYGDTRRQVLGVEAVLADASVLSRLGGLAKDSTGYDLSGLLVGSEGTLGIVTAARLRLVPRRDPGTVVLVGCAGVEDAQRLVPASGVRAAELMFAAGVDLVRRVAGLPRPLQADWPAYLLLETDDVPDLPDGVDAAVHPRLWDYRERHTEAISTVGVPHKLDVAVPHARLGELVAALPDAVAPHHAYVFGHIAEANLHVNVVGPAPDDDTVDDAVLRLVCGLGGSISAEHGVGRAKTGWLGLCRSEAEVAAMRRVKAALDPAGILNPGALLGPV
ncbi:MAG: FAD-binding oxidoreductase [Actinomycetota bacterium]|nr:FAD-binding oxidoreductase [Actinomycetota bacterium]